MESEKNKALFMLVVMLLSITSQFITTIGTINAFAETVGENIINKPSAHLLPVVDGNRTILTSVKMQVEGSDGKLEDLTEDRPLKVDEKFQINYTFELPDALSKEVREGDYFEFDLPKSNHIQLTSEQSGELIDLDNSDVHGTYHADRNGHVKMIFNDKVQFRDDVDGTLQFRMYFEEKTITVPEGYEINFPYVTNDSNQIIYVVGKIDSYIQKEYIGNDGFTFRWKVLINPTYQPMRNLRLIENAKELGGGNAVAESINIEKMVKADVNLNGDITEKEEINLSNKIFENGATMDLGFNSIDEPYVMYINTPFPYGIKNNVENRITLFADVKGKEIGQNAAAQSNAGSYIVLDKKVLSYDKENQIIEWQTTFNPNSLPIPQKDAKFRDEITNGLLMEETMTVSPNLSHTVNVANNKEAFDFQFNTDVNQAVVIRYKTKVKDPSLGTVRNKVISGEQVVDVPQNVEGDGGQNPGGDGNSSITKSVRPGPDWANWTININSEKQQVDKWWVTDKLDSGTVKTNSVVVTNTSTNQKLNPNTDYDIEWITSSANPSEVIGFTIRYNRPTNNSFKIEYQSNYERNTSQTNHAYYHYYVEGNEKEDDDSATYNPPQVGEIGLSKSGRYLPDKREIEWTVLLNENGKVPAAENNLMRDPIMDDQTYVNGSAKVEYRDGTVWNPLNQANVNFNEGDNQLEVSNFKMTSNAQRVIFRTKLKNNIDILNREIENTAYYKDSFTREKSAKASLTIDNANDHLLKKRGKQNVNNSDFVDWEVDINPYSFKLDNLVIVDDSWENQVVRRESIKLVDTASNRELYEGIDYDLEYTERYFKISMKNRVESKLLLTYQGRLIYPYGTPLGSNQIAKNSVRVTANGIIKTDRPIEVTIPVKVSDSSGTIQGKTKDLNVKKVSLDNSNQTLSGAEFVLYRGTEKDPNKLVNRVTTGDNGIAHFDKLTKGDYLLVETKAPSGYDISSELKNGRIVTISTENTTTVEEIVANPKTGQEVKLIDFPVEKKWKNVPSEINTPSVRVTLYADSDNNEVSHLELNSGNDYKGVFRDLPEEKNGQKINYYVKESDVPNYDSTVSGGTITNTYNNTEKTSISGKKEWDDDGNKAKKRPDRVKIELLQDKNHYKYDYVYATDDWKFEFDNLPKVNNETGKDYIYTVREEGVPDGYETSVTGTTIKNTFKEAETTSLSGKKIWDDNNDAAKDRPTSVVVVLQQDGDYYDEKVVTSSSNWEYRFEGLPKINAETGTPHEYTVIETNIPDGYEMQVEGDDIRNTYTKVELFSLSGEKIWKDSGNLAGKRPSDVTIKLLRNKLYYKETKASPATNWRYRFDDLPRRDEDGNPYNYEIEEVDVPTGYISQVDGTTITNTYTETPVEKVDVEGEKKWIDDNNQDKKRPANITVLLMRDDNNLKPYDTKVVTPGSDGRWTYKFSNLPKYDSNGREYKYTVKENPVKDYETSNSGKYDLTNTYIKPTKKDINGKKVWRDEDNIDGKRPGSVTIQLLQNEQPYKTTEAKPSTWEYSFKDVPIYDQSGEPYRYEVKELNVPAEYTSTVSGTVITNTYKPVPKDLITIEGEKNWDDYNGSKNTRPDYVDIELYRNDNSIRPYEIQRVYKTGSNRWPYKFVDLPKYESAGKEYIYEVREATVPNYVGSKFQQYSLLNTLHLRAKTKVTGEKIWDDEDDKDDIRPSKVKVTLLANGSEVVPKQTREVSAATNWQFTFDDLDMYDSRSQIIKYTVKEERIDGYVDYYSTAKDDPYHIIVRNKHTVKPVEKISINGEKKWEDQNNGFTKRPPNVIVDLYQDGVKQNEFREVSEATNWQYEFSDLLKYKGNTNEEYKYTVKERDVPPGYESTVNGYDITNRYLNNEVTQVSGEKIWDDYNNKFETRPENITVKLYRDKTFLKEQVVSEETNWKYLFTDLPVYDDQANKIVYRVEEHNVPNGYTSEIGDNKITNTYRNNEKTEVSGKKIWNDYNNKFGTRPEQTGITVYLYNGNEKIAEQTIKPDSKGDWSYTFKDLDKYDDKGEAIAYTVKEKPVDKYSTEVKGDDIYNTYVNPEKTEISVVKEWQDNSNAFEIRPLEITVNLFRNGAKVNTPEGSKQLSENNNWKHTFTNLDKYDNNGDEYIYTVVEEGIPNYITTHSEEPEKNSVTIINKLNDKETLTSLSGKKIWDDYNNKFATRKPVTVILLQDNVEMKDDTNQVIKQVVNEDNNWEYSFDNLPKINPDTKKDFVYSVKEEPVPGYEQPIYDGSNIINRYRNTEEININGYKSWDDYGNKFNTRPDSFKVNLLQDNKILETKDVNKSDDYAFTFSHLPKYDENGVEYEYSVVEEVPDPYTVSEEIKKDKENNTITVTLTNTYKNTEVVSIKGNKIWDDYDNKFNTQPTSVNVQLIRSSESVTNEVVSNQQITASNNWHYEFTELPKYDEEGDEYTYTVREAVIESDFKYTSEVVGNDIINHYVNDTKVNFSGEKIWDDYDNKFETRPETVTIYLYSGDTKIETTQTDASQNWKYEFIKGYPIYDSLGNEIEYSIKEETVPEYTTIITETPNSTKDIKDYTITNKYVNTEKMSIPVSKTWDDFDNKFKERPEKIKVTLSPTNEEATLSAENDWQHEFKELLVYDENGDKIDYTITEEVIDSYEQTQGAPDFINRAKELDAKTSISGSKIWEDEDNKLGTRPSSITVTLYQNDSPMLNAIGQPITQEVTVTDGWRYEFINLPKYDEFGELYIYSVAELKVENYESIVANNDIINAYINNEKIEVNGEKTWLDLDNKLGTRPESIVVKLYQSGMETPYASQTVRPDENGDWKYTFTDLPKYDDKLDEYTYHVEEEIVEHYTTENDGFNLVNTYKNDQVTEVNGEKLWYDIDNKLNSRPESITVELYQNNGSEPFKTQEVKPDEEGNWNYSFTNLPKYDDNYDLYDYAIKETPVEHYETSLYDESDTTIHNHYINDDKTNVKVLKKWNDQGNKLNTRPKSIRVNLYQNNGRIPYKTQVILPNENGSWSYEFKDLPKYDNNLNLYEYTVTEMRVPDYTATVVDDQTNNVSTITNTYNNAEKVEVNGFKAWLDHDNKLGTRPKSIFVDLYQSGSDLPYQTQEVKPNEDGYWYYSFKDLPKYDDELNLYTYTIKEQPVANYDSQVSDTNIINSYRNDTVIDVSGKKIWNDFNNKLKTRPESITIELYQGKKLYESQKVVAGEDGNWLYEFTDLPKYNANLEEYVYTVREPKVSGYETEINGTTITNSYQNTETVSVPVKKIWDDESNKLETRPSMIKVDLYQNGGDKPFKTEMLLPNGTNEWTYEFTELPKYDENLDEYKYTVKEQPVEGYETTIEGTTIINKFVNNQLTSIKGEKQWNDYDNKLGVRPEKIYVDLYQSGNERPIATEIVEADKNGHWEYEFVNLPKYDDKLNEYTYAVKERKVPHYDTEIVAGTIINTYRNDETVEVNGKKVWDDLDNKLNTRPSFIRVDLYRNDSVTPLKSKKVVADEAGDWNYSFKDLPKYDADLNPYTYTVKERAVKGYTSTVDETTITNKYLNNEKTSISGKKVWQDKDNTLSSRPESIIVELHQNGSEEVMDKKEIMPDADGNWEYSFTDLPKYDDNLEKYTYSVAEKVVPHYDTSVSGTTITNTYRNDEKVKVEGQKIWKDVDNKLNTRPKSIKVDLYQNEDKEPFKTAIVKADTQGDWKYLFEDLPKYDDQLVEYRYTVKEQPVNNYESEVVGLSIENTYQNTDTINVKGKKTWDDVNNKLGTRPTEIFVELYQTTKDQPEVTEGQSPYRIQKVQPTLHGSWEYEFTDLPKYDDNLDKYNYVVKEHVVKDYDSEVSGFDIKNTYQNKETVTIDGEKIWKNDADNKIESRPESIVINLYQNNSEEVYQTQKVSADKDGNWSYSFKNLPKYDEQLNEYQYTVKELPVDHYESHVKGTTITNTYQNTDLTDLKGQKQWNDEGDKLKKRPKSITVDLYQNNGKKPIATQKVTAGKDNQWKYEFNDLAKYDKDLNEYEYTVKEHEIDGYSTIIEGTTIVNTYKNVETTQISGEKKWEDFENKLKVRPSVITVNLYQNDSKEAFRSQLVVADENGDWKYSFKELPKYDEKLNEYTYTVKEQTVPHYTSAVEDTTITNTYRNDEKINVDGKKVWKDFDDKLKVRPNTITVELYQNDDKVPFKTQEVSAGEKNDWSYSFKDLPKYDEELNEYTYTVKEKEVTRYETSIEGTTITNAYRNDDVTQIKGEKNWEDFDDKLKERPETITIELYQNDSPEVFKIQEISAGSDNKWRYEFKDLPKYDEELNEYTYTVKEKTVAHYDTVIDGTKITNTYRNDDLTEIKGKKVWNDLDNKLNVRPKSITVELYQNNSKEPYKTQEVKAGLDKQWRYSFKNLPKYDENLNEYEYKVKEVEVPHYDTVIEGTTITNTYRNDDVTKVVGEKIWNDFDNKLSSRPESITIELYQNDSKEPFKTQEVKVDENNHWRYSFDELPKYDAELNEFTYTVKEVEVPHYDSSIENTTITNTYRNDDLTEVKGKKLWDDLDNKLEVRPNEITVELYQNGGEKPYKTQQVKADEEDNWNYTFKNLPKYDDNLVEYVYIVKEKEVKYYDSKIEGTTIINTYRNDDKTQVKGEKRWKDVDNKLKTRPQSIIVELYQNGGKEPFRIQEVSGGESNTWGYSFDELPKYDKELKEYTYTVKEKKVSGYESEVVGTNIINSYVNDDKTEIKGQKLWEDNNDKEKIRPDSIVVEVYQNNSKEPYQTQVVKPNQAEEWNFEFKDLPKYDKALEEYTYTLREVEVKGYQSKIEGTTITNTIITKEKPVTPKDPNLPKSDRKEQGFLPKTNEVKDGFLASLLGVTLLSATSIGLYVRRRKS